jgi:ABC-type Na+ efflux pump permease subunit
MSLTAWVVVIALAILWLAVAIASAGFKVHQQRRRLDTFLQPDDVENAANPRHREQAPPSEVRRPKTWPTIVAALIVFGIALAALALLADTFFHTFQP